MKRFKNVSRLVVLSLSIFCVACTQPKQHTLVILHTNDTHSQVEPLEAGKRDAHCGGYARRMGYVAAERKLNSNLLLMDAGDFCQGSPYFNFFHGRVEVDAMNNMGYDVITLGNHEFDYGVDTLAAMLSAAKFEVVCANYDVSNSALEGLVKPYTVLRRDGLRIGVFGLGTNPYSLITERNFYPLQYLDPIESAERTADILKHKKRCDVVICLSHQGTHIKDIELAEKTRNIDVIIGGHTHKIVENMMVNNLDGDSVLLAQSGKSGARIGKITLQISK